MLPVAESKTLFPYLELITQRQYWPVAGGSVDSPRPQNLVELSKMVSPRILKDD